MKTSSELEQGEQLIKYDVVTTQDYYYSSCIHFEILYTHTKSFFFHCRHAIFFKKNNSQGLQA